MANYCYMSMFLNCTSLKQLPLLPSTELADYCYYGMFQNDSNIKLSATQTTPYLTLYKVPNIPVFYYDTLWNNNIVTTSDSECVVADTLVTAKDPMTLPAAAYALAETTTFNGSNTYIDTGISLFSSDESFTIFVDFKYNSSSNYMTVFHCMYEVSPYPGAQLDINNSKFRIGYYGNTDLVAYDTNRHRAMIIHTGGTGNAGTYYWDSNTAHATPASKTYTAVSQHLLFGCYQASSGVKGRYFNGIMYDARVYNEVLSAVQIEYLMSGPPWSIKESTLSGLTFSSNGNTYDSMYCDSTGNLYYGASGANTKVYDVSIGWVSDNYKSLTVPSDKSLFENLFVNGNAGDWLTFKEQNLTITYGWSVREQSLSLPFKSNSTDYSQFNVDANGNILYDTTTVYDATNGWVNNNYKTIQTTFHTSPVFVGANSWSPFYTTNKSSVTQSTITIPTDALTDMFKSTGGTFTGTPELNKAYWLSISTIERVFEWDYTDGNNGLLSVSSSVADATYEYRANGLYLYSGTTQRGGINVGFPSVLYSRLKATISSITIEMSYINHDTTNGQLDAVIIPTTRTTTINSAKVYFLGYNGGMRASGRGTIWNFGSSHPSSGTVKVIVDFNTDMFTAFLDGTQVGTISEITSNLGNNGSALLSVTNNGQPGTTTITHIRITWQEASL